MGTRNDSTKKKPAAPEPPRLLGEDDEFGEETFARGLKAVTQAISDAASHQGPIPAKKASPKPAAKKKR